MRGGGCREGENCGGKTTPDRHNSGGMNSAKEKLSEDITFREGEVPDRFDLLRSSRLEWVSTWSKCGLP